MTGGSGLPWANRSMKNGIWNSPWAATPWTATRGGSYDQYGMGLDGLYFFKRDPVFAPFAVVGAGYLRTDIPGASDDSLMANAGLGFLKRLSDGVDLRADARYRWATNDLPGIRGNALGDWLVSIGLNITLGAKATSPAAVARRPEPVMVKPEPRPEPAPMLV